MLIETQARRPTEIVFAVFVPVRWAKRAFIRTQKNGCGGNLTITAAAFFIYRRWKNAVRKFKNAYKSGN